MNGFVNTLRSLGAARLLAIGIVIIGILGFFAFITLRIATPPLGLLYSGLDPQDAGDIVAKLDGLNIKYELTADGTSVMVPESEIARLRMTMAENGLPSGGSMGYEIFDQTDAFGTTSFVQNINRVRALEGELARTIRTIDRISAARVHLVLPERRLFNRKALGPSASIVIKTRGGELTPGQVRAIQHLVAAAVPNLTPARVSVVDDKGNLLAPGMNESGKDAMASSQRTRQVAYENRLKHQLQTLLEKSVGRGKVQVEVSADIDFDRVTTSSELYDPDRQVVLSTQTVEENQRSQEPTDVGGDVSVAKNLPDSQAPAGTAASSTKTRTEETTNFENSKIVKTETKEAGQIKRLSVAVLVDGVYTKSQDGTRSYKPRSQDEMDRLTALVHSAIGYDADRGDTVEIVNLPFTVEEPPAIEEAPSGFLGLDLTKADIFRIVELIVFSLVGLLTMLFVVRPLITRLFAGGPVPAIAGGGQITDATGEHPALAGPDGDSPDQTAAIASDGSPIALPKQASRVESMIDVATIDGQIQQSAVKKVGEIVEKHPDEAVSILRTWLHE